MTEINLTKKEEKEMLLKAMFGSPFFNILASVLATFIVGAVFFKYGGGVPINVTSTTTEKTSTFDVSGEGKVVVIPDEARVRMGVRREGLSVESLQEQVNSVMTELIAELDELGIKKEDVRTASYSVNPNYRERGLGPQEYMAYAEVEVKIKEMENVSAVLDLVGPLGLEQVGGQSFGLSDTLEEESKKDAREMAIAQAKDSAHELSQLAGMKLGKIVNVQESGAYPIPYQVREMSFKSGSEDEAMISTPVEPGSSEIVVSVTLSYEVR